MEEKIELGRSIDDQINIDTGLKTRCLEMALQTRVPDDKGNPTFSITPKETIEAAQLFYDFITSKN